MRRSFKVFLSHRYKSAKVNLYFFELLGDVAELQFEIDEGQASTSVTRLERMVRGSDAFVGIYPYDGPDPPQPADLQQASRYFRLELDLAIRSDKPAIVFCDDRYGALLRCPPPVQTVTFDAQEVAGSGGHPSADRHRSAFVAFCDTVEAWRMYETARGDADRSKVILLLPEDGYAAAAVDAIGERLEHYGFDDHLTVRWPPRVSRPLRALVSSADLVITDVLAAGPGAALTAYLHARCVPMIRLAHVPGDVDVLAAPLPYALFSDYDVGYPKDIARWSDVAGLTAQIDQRLAALRSRVRRVRTLDEAKEYFLSSRLRKDPVFLSYSGADADPAATVSASLKARFQTVFDYRDGESLRAGQEWLPGIFDRLAASAAGVMLLSPAYLASGNCEHEAMELVALRDQKKLALLPVKLRDESLDLPSWLRAVQYERLYNSTPDALADEVVRLLDP